MDFKTFSKSCASLVGNTTWTVAKSSASVAVGAKLLGLAPISNAVAIAAAGGAVLGATRSFGLKAYSFFCKSEPSQSVVASDNNVCTQVILKTFVEMGKELASTAIGYGMLSHIASFSLGEIALATTAGFACLIPVTALIILGTLGWDKMKELLAKDYGIETEEDKAFVLSIAYEYFTKSTPKHALR